MKKIYISILTLLLIPANFLKSVSCDSIKMTLSLTKNKNRWGADIINKNLAECITILKNLSEFQKKRALTIEELNIAYYAFVYIFTTLHEDYSGKITITMNDKDNLNLPFSLEIFMNLFLNILKDQENLDSSESE